MTRWLAGAYNPRGEADSSRLARALAPHASTVVFEGGLGVAYSGPARGSHRPLCLLDGYLDNAPELSAALGIPPGSPPEELLLLGWRRWGRGLPQRMRGDFALLLWDGEQCEGLLARDQMGARSMFLHESSGRLSFACEIRHLLALLPRRPAPDPASVAHWLTMSSRPGSATLYAGVRRLDPGTMLLLERGGVREERYWAPRFAEPLAGSRQHLARRVRSALEEAVGRRLGSSGPTGVLMSGGLDSAAVAAVAARRAPGGVHAYSAVFPEHPAVDESALIDELRSRLGVPGITAEVRPGGLLASALEAIQEWDAPLRSWGDFWALPLLRAAASEGVGMMLGGDGGDELLGARAYLLADRLRLGHPLQALALARELPGAGDRPPRRELARIVGEVAVAGALPYGLDRVVQPRLRARQLPRWLRARSIRELLDSDDPVGWKRLDGPRWWANVAHGLTRGVEEAGVFEHQRRRAASAGLDARCPMLDLDVVELSLRIPPAASFDRHRNRPILRSCMAGLLPESVRLRPRKALFDSVIIDSLAGSDGPAVRRLLSDPKAELGAYVDLPGLRRALFDADGQRQEQSFQWMWQVWRLTTAECWLRAQEDHAGGVLPTGARPAPKNVVLRAASSAARKGASYVFPP